MDKDAIDFNLNCSTNQYTETLIKQSYFAVKKVVVS